MDLTPEQEAKFFETGELPPEATPVAAPVEVAQPQEVAAPAVQTPTPPAPPAVDPYTVLQRQLIEAESRRAATEQQLNDLVAQLQELREPPQAVPDPQTDPFGHLQHQVTAIGKAIQGLQSNLDTQTQQAQQAQQLQQFVTHVREQRDIFIKTNPDFADAYKHIREVRANDLRDAGVSEAQLPQMLFQDEMVVAQAAISAGRNPAQALYDMAKRHGYVVKTATTTPQPDAAARIALAQAGQAAAVAVPRGAVEVTLTPTTLKDAGEDDINKLVQSDELWQKVIGGHAAGKNIF